jgi:hypothetical protein
MLSLELRTAKDTQSELIIHIYVTLKYAVHFNGTPNECAQENERITTMEATDTLHEDKWNKGLDLDDEQYQHQTKILLSCWIEMVPNDPGWDFSVVSDSSILPGLSQRW